jgi:hypothetical protein
LASKSVQITPRPKNFALRSEPIGALGGGHAAPSPSRTLKWLNALKGAVTLSKKERENSASRTFSSDRDRRAPHERLGVFWLK